MTDGISANVQALGALGSVLQATSNNIANVSTEGYQPLRVGLADGPGGQGVHVGSVSREASGGGVYVATEMVGLMQTGRAYSANAAVIRAADETAGSVLNIIA